jgi:hypothetical protein
VFKSTQGGQAMHYQDYSGKKFFHFLESREIIED